MKNWSAYRKLYLSYAGILLIPLVMAVLFYSYSYQVVERQADASNSSLIRTLQETCDRELEYYGNALLQLGLDSTIQQLSTVHGNFKSKDYYKLYTLQREINDLQIAINRSGNYCNDITIYFRNNGKVVSTRGCMDLKMYCELYGFEDEASIAWLENYFSEYHVTRAIRIREKLRDGSSPLLLTMTNMKGEFGETSAMVGLWIDMDALSRSMRLNTKENGMDWLLIDENSQIISRAEEFEQIGLAYDELEEGSGAELEFRDEKYILSILPSHAFDWKYVLMMPEKIIGRSVKRLRNFFTLSLVVCLGVGFWAATLMTRRSYDPIKSLLDMFRKYDRENRTVENEYVYLREKAMRLFEEHSQFREKLHESREVIRQYYLIDTLINPSGEQENTPERKEICRKFNRGGVNRVLLLKIREEDTGEGLPGEEPPGEGPSGAGMDAPDRKPGEEVSQKQRESGTERNNLQKFIVGNVFGEGLSEAFDMEIAELGDASAALVNIPGDSCAVSGQLLEIIDNMQKFIFDNFGFRVAVLAGECHEGLGGLHRSYREAREAESFLPLLDSDYISYREIRDTSNRNYKYSMSQEERIISAIRKNDSQLAISCINGVLDVNFRQLRTSPAMRRCLLYDLAGTLIKAAQEMEGRSVEELDLKVFSSKLSYQEIRDRFAGVVEKMCRQPEAEPAGDANSQLCGEIRRYIQENFGDPDLNVSQIGQHFHITPAYLSSIYKKSTGESLLRALNETRIREAEKLLKEGASVVETAEKAGFRDSSTFIRAFKKATGATPGQLKNSKRNN